MANTAKIGRHPDLTLGALASKRLFKEDNTISRTFEGRQEETKIIKRRSREIMPKNIKEHIRKYKCLLLLNCFVA